MSITFFEWCIAAIPIVFVMLAAGFVVLNLFFRIDVKDVGAARKVLGRELENIGPMGILETKTAAIFVWIFLAWMWVWR